jgi:hypothetical protein
MSFTSILLLGSTLLAGRSIGINEDFSVTTSGEDILWTCSEVLHTEGEYYEMFYTIINASVMVQYIGLTFGPIDVTDMIPSEYIVTWQPEQAPMPMDFDWHLVLAPAGQDPPSLSFDWIVEVDAKGVVRWRGENVYLGEADYDLGWPWGSVTVQIVEGTIHANLEIVEVFNPCYEDIDQNGVVDVSDLLTLIGNWGPCADCTQEVPGDVNYDDVVDVTDLLAVVAAWGPCL